MAPKKRGKIAVDRRTSQNKKDEQHEQGEGGGLDVLKRVAKAVSSTSTGSMKATEQRKRQASPTRTLRKSPRNTKVTSAASPATMVTESTEAKRPPSTETPSTITAPSSFMESHQQPPPPPTAAISFAANSGPHFAPGSASGGSLAPSPQDEEMLSRSSDNSLGRGDEYVSFCKACRRRAQGGNPKYPHHRLCEKSIYYGMAADEADKMVAERKKRLRDTIEKKSIEKQAELSNTVEEGEPVYFQPDPKPPEEAAAVAPTAPLVSTLPSSSDEAAITTTVNSRGRVVMGRVAGPTMSNGSASTADGTGTGTQTISFNKLLSPAHLCKIIDEYEAENVTKAPKGLEPILHYIHSLAPALRKGTNNPVDGRENELRQDWYRNTFPPGTISWTIPRQDAMTVPHILYRAIEGCTIIYTRWELQCPLLRCCYCKTGTLIASRLSFTKSSVIPVYSLENKPAWVLPMNYQCNQCNSRVLANDPHLLHSLPKWLQKAYPVDPAWVRKSQPFQVTRSVGELLEMTDPPKDFDMYFFVADFVKKNLRALYKADKERYETCCEELRLFNLKPFASFEAWYGSSDQVQGSTLRLSHQIAADVDLDDAIREAAVRRGVKFKMSGVSGEGGSGEEIVVSGSVHQDRMDLERKRAGPGTPNPVSLSSPQEDTSERQVPDGPVIHGQFDDAPTNTNSNAGKAFSRRTMHSPQKGYLGYGGYHPGAARPGFPYPPPPFMAPGFMPGLPFPPNAFNAHHYHLQQRPPKNQQGSDEGSEKQSLGKSPVGGVAQSSFTSPNSGTAFRAPWGAMLSPSPKRRKQQQDEDSTWAEKKDIAKEHNMHRMAAGHHPYMAGYGRPGFPGFFHAPFGGQRFPPVSPATASERSKNGEEEKPQTKDGQKQHQFPGWPHFQGQHHPGMAGWATVNPQAHMWQQQMMWHQHMMMNSRVGGLHGTHQNGPISPIVDKASVRLRSEEKEDEGEQNEQENEETELPNDEDESTNKRSNTVAEVTSGEGDAGHAFRRRSSRKTRDMSSS